MLSNYLLKKFSVLKYKDYRKFWFSRVFTTLGYQMLTVAVGWKMYEITHSTFYLGLVGLAQFLPMIILSLAVGQIVDHYDRRIIIRACQMVEALGIFILAAGSHYGWLNAHSLLAIVFAIGAARAFESPAMQALLPGLVDTEILPQAIALSASSFQTATIIGPALGGFLYIYGAENVFLTVAGLFMVSSLLISSIHTRQYINSNAPINRETVFAGISFIRSKSTILGAISLDLFAVLLGGATALLPVYAKEILMIGPIGLGLLRSAPAVGALGMSLFLANTPLKNDTGKKMFIAVIIFGLSTIVFALSKTIWLSLLALIVLGASDTISVVIRSSLVQLQTPDEMRGRVSAVNFMFVGTSNQLGEFESGILASLVGTVPSAALGGIGTIVVALLWMKLFPELRQMDKLQVETE
jgi:MFS family permease